MERTSRLIISWSFFLLLTVTLFLVSENLWQQKVTLPEQVPQVYITEPDTTKKIMLYQYKCVGDPSGRPIPYSYPVGTDSFVPFPSSCEKVKELGYGYSETADGLIPLYAISCHIGGGSHATVTATTDTSEFPKSNGTPSDAFSYCQGYSGSGDGGKGLGVLNGRQPIAYIYASATEGTTVLMRKRTGSRVAGGYMHMVSTTSGAETGANGFTYSDDMTLGYILPVGGGTPPGTVTPTLPPDGDSQFLNLKLLLGGITSRPNDASAREIKIYATSLDGGPSLGSTADKRVVTVAPNDNGVYEGRIVLDNSYFGHHYRVRVKGPLHVQVVFADVVFKTDEVLDLTVKPLLPGDLDGKGYAASADLDKVWARLHSTTVDDLAVADVNYDQVVGIDDYALILKTLSVNYDAD